MGGVSTLTVLSTNCGGKGDDGVWTPVQFNWDELQTGVKLTSVSFDGFETDFSSFTFATAIGEDVTLANGASIAARYYPNDTPKHGIAWVRDKSHNINNMFAFTGETQTYNDSFNTKIFSHEEESVLLIVKTPLIITDIGRSTIDPTLHAFFQTATFNCLVRIA
ncbi:MAG: hypothetical protein LBV53_02630 [Mycoplasmataceae bacterium]|nr:hypothetical protein [Mycoplasmataceae bacterium]